MSDDATTTPTPPVPAAEPGQTDAVADPAAEPARSDRVQVLAEEDGYPTALAYPDYDMVVRRATRSTEDRAARCDLLASVPMKSDLVLTVQRNEDFDMLYHIQSDRWECWVGEQGGDTVGMGTILVRDGYIAGASAPVGYLGDLRLSPKIQGMHLLGQFYGPVLKRLSETHGCDHFYAVIIASNRQAIRALTGPTAADRGIPPYTLLRQFDIRALHLTVPRRPRRYASTVRRATDVDIPEIAALLDADGRRRPLGYPCDEAELRRRLASWPGFRIEDFFCAINGDGAMTGVIAIWNPEGVKRTIVDGYRGSMKKVRVGYNSAAVLGRFTPLPKPGGALHYAYATHQAIANDDPDTMAALVDAVYRAYRRSGLNFINFCVWDGDPLAPAFNGFFKTDLRANLYLVTLPDYEIPPHLLDPATNFPGFEMALVS